ncbi:MAG: DUF362 domain-containing protein [Sedimentisphaerales bacterium]|nr:DUF362 domain-containing protein [Sedimentisphaerales bacterium]
MKGLYFLGGMVMSFLKSKYTPRTCPKTGKIIGSGRKSRLLWLFFPITGLAALIWFLIRVIPKPSRAMYPCQRVAFPIASGFVVWLIGITGSAVAYHKAKRALSQTRYILAAVCIVVSVGFILTAMSGTNENVGYAHEPIVHNNPIGEAKGVQPGRVAWIHDPDATNWGGGTSAPYPYENTCTDQAVVNEMFSKGIRALAGEYTDADAWDAIFRNFNQRMGKGDVGYTSGEKIAIKINFVLMYSHPWNGEMPTGVLSRISNSPQLAIALLKQLIDVVGVSPGNISIGDCQMMMPNHWYNMVHAQCPGVVYMTRAGVSHTGRTAVTLDYSAPFYWSDPCAAHMSGVTKQDYIPTHLAQSDYFINFPILKSHNSGGITLSGKNHYGSLSRTPNESGYYNMHNTRPANDDGSPYATPGMGYYRANVDLMGHPKLGGKTMLVLIDALYAGRSWDSQPIKWAMPPFNNDWPSSIFLSQDQVAADSVAFDFMDYEWDGAVGSLNGYPQYSGTDDYLHEAAMIPTPDSGVTYDPADDGGLTESLGVHEHWDNAIDKQYSRNLDPVSGTGIELVTAPPEGLIGDFDGDDDIDFEDFAVLAAAWYSEPGDDNWDPDCDISTPADSIIDEFDLAAFCDNWLL